MSRNPTAYDQALICENGHVATSMLQRAPEHHAPFCAQCGRPNISECPGCGAPIRGYYFSGGIGGGYPRPGHCVRCGSPFPWQVAALEAARELADEIEELSPDERERLKQSLEEIASDSPKTELAAGRIRKTIQRLGGPTGRLLEKVAETVATEAAKAAMRGGL